MNGRSYQARCSAGRSGRMIAGERPRYALVLSALGAVALAVAAFLPWYGVGAIAGRLPATPACGAPAAVQVILLVLAALALLDALLGLARASGAPPAGAGASVAVLAVLATACVAYRMIEPPAPAGAASSVALREGAWLALVSSVAMIVGGLWPRVELAASPSEGALRGLGSVPGVTPGA
jgi:hypothetical protein